MASRPPLERFGAGWLTDDAVTTQEETLDAGGIDAADRVGVVARPDRHTACALAALWRRRAVPVVINPHAPPALRDEIVTEAAARAWIDDGELHPARGATTPPAPGVELAVVLATSGSSGRPRLIAHDADTLLTRAQHAARELAFGPDASWLVSLPTHHVGGLSIWLRAHVGGGRLDWRDRAESLADALTRAGSSHVSLVPTQLADLLAEPIGRHALARCRCVLVGGASLSIRLRRAALEARVPLVVSYGTTETAAFVAWVRDPQLVIEADVAGHPLPDVVVDVDPRGSIRVAGGLHRGEFRQGRFVPRPPGPHDTGDVGSVDDSGLIRIAGRRDAMFQCGGENVHPEALERALLEHPAVRDAVVLPREEPRLGAVPVALVDLDDRAREDVGAAIGESLTRHLSGRVPEFFVPRAWWKLPRSRGIKPSRHDLAALAARGALEPL